MKSIIYKQFYFGLLTFGAVNCLRFHSNAISKRCLSSQSLRRSNLPEIFIQNSSLRPTLLVLFNSKFHYESTPNNNDSIRETIDDINDGEARRSKEPFRSFVFHHEDLENSHRNTQEPILFNSNSNSLFSSSLLLLLLTPLLFIAFSLCSTLFQTLSVQAIEMVNFDPAMFNPICHFSDVIYQFLKAFVALLIGSENVTEYGPIISSLLLRIRLELCVIESYFFEAVAPFISQRGLSWVLPFHETIETLLTGSIFAIATNIILLTSTKIISFILLCIDLFTGVPARFIGNLIKKISQPKSTDSSSGSSSKNNSGLNVFLSILQVYGTVIGTIKNTSEVIDNFINKYLFLTTAIYIGFKFLHFKFFNY